MYQISFLFKTKIQIWVYTMFCISILPSMDIWVVSPFWLLWIMLLWTWMYKHLFSSLFSILLSICPEVELLCLTFEELPYSFLHWLHHFTFSPTTFRHSNFSTASPTLAIFFFFLNNGHLNGLQIDVLLSHSHIHQSPYLKFI